MADLSTNKLRQISLDFERAKEGKILDIANSGALHWNAGTRLNAQE
jgi:hypothetical protein